MYLSYNILLVPNPPSNLPPPLSPFPEMRSYPYLAFPLLAAATTGVTGGDRMGGGMCPGTTRYATEALLVYSPFTPYWAFNVSQRNAEACWVVADCLFEAAGESRKQQFGATALVMGLIPPTIKDIAWPERRIVYVTKNLHWVVEMLVLALGLVPQVTGDQKETRRLGCEGALVADWAWRNNTMRIRVLVISVFVGALGICYGSLVAMEVFSKRSALGCVVPAFIVAWHIVALIPAAIHLLFSRYGWGRKAEDREGLLRSQGNSDVGQHKEKVASAVPGASEYWPVQMAWGIYYIAGTLVFTSIMAVTVPELTVWVILGLVTAACSKILALFLCLVCEDTYGMPGDGSERIAASTHSNETRPE
jgi:hypothetical protein